MSEHETEDAPRCHKLEARGGIVYPCSQVLLSGACPIHGAASAREGEADVENGEMTRIGDRLQSEASRLAEWVRCECAPTEIPYEVRQALVGVESAVAEWTKLRSG